MSSTRYSIVILGLSMTSSWGNGHATTYRALVRQLVLRGHDVLFLERDVPYYRAHRDLPGAGHGQIELYGSREELWDRFGQSIRHADVVMLGSYVPEGTLIGQWLVSNAKGHKVFYDIDTPITLRNLTSGNCEYLSLQLVPRFDLYLSFTGGPTLARLEESFGARRARPLYCSVDPDLYFPEDVQKSWDLGYLGTFSSDRQPTVTRFLLVPAKALPRHRFVVAGAQYPEELRARWPVNVRHIDHVAPHEHRAFYGAQRLTLNTTRQDMIAAGYSPSVRLFEAGACGTPIVSDLWPGIESFFAPGREILLAHSSAEVASFVTRMADKEVAALGQRARKRVLAEHTAAHRAEALEGYLAEIPTSKRAGPGKTTPKAATNEAEP
jgi:spore maturation protein CgeB